MKARCVLVLHVVILSFLPHAATPATAQSPGTKVINRITFEAGAKTAFEEGAVAPPVTVGPDMTNDGVERYTLAARARQYFSIQLSSDNQKALFTLVKPSAGGAKTEPVGGAAGVRRWSGRLSAPGDYLLTVFTRDREAPSHFKLRVTTR